MNTIKLNTIGEVFAKGGQVTPPSGGNVEYYSIDWEKAKELGYDESDTSYSSYTNNLLVILGMAQTVCFYKQAIMTTSGIVKTNYLKEAYIDRVQYRFPIITTDLDKNRVECNTLNEIVTKRVDNINIIIDGIFTPITEEQFYAL